MEQRNAISAVKEKLKQMLSHRYAGFFIVITVIIARIIQQIYFFNTRNDMTYQVLAAQHLLDGHGISYASIAANDLSHIFYQPLNQWPPGFSVLFIPFYILLGKNYIAAALALGIFCAILLIVTSRAILKLLEVPGYLINLFTILSGFFGYYFYTKCCTDAIGISFLLIAFYYSLLLIKKSGSLTKNILLLTTSLLICGFIKYLFMPAVLVIPFFLIAKGIAAKESPLKKAGAISFFVLLIAFGAFFLYQQNISGSVGYVKEQGRGFFPENLKATFPFITGSFIKPDSHEQFFPLQAGKYFFQIISVAFFAVLLFFFLKGLVQNHLKKQCIRNDFFYLSFFVSSVIISLLVFLSLRVAKEPIDQEQFWTYVEEPRYYGIITVLLHIGVFALYPWYKSTKKVFLKYLFPVLILFMIPEMIRGFAFTANRFSRINREKYGWQYELQFQKKINQIISNLSEKGKNRMIILYGTSDWFTLRAGLYSHIPILKESLKKINSQELKTTKPVTVLAIIGKDDFNQNKHFISSESVRSEGNGYGFFFYSFDINP
ncbi:MAG TPA: hypothetical protein VN451_01140 [Chitinophagaceae bacterium]|nr:hypothetical protein [Chitinophagaceae bacterium]